MKIEKEIRAVKYYRWHPFRGKTNVCVATFELKCPVDEEAIWYGGPIVEWNSENHAILMPESEFPITHVIGYDAPLKLVSPTIAQLLRSELDDDDIQLLPIKAFTADKRIVIDNYYMMHVIQRADCVNLKASKTYRDRERPDELELAYPGSVVLDIHKIPSHKKLFRPTGLSFYIIVRADLVKKIKSVPGHGTRFDEIDVIPPNN